MYPSTKPVKEKIFCSALDAANMLDITATEVEALVDAGTIESWPGADGRKLILRQSVMAMGGKNLVDKGTKPENTRAVLAYVIDDSHEVLQHYQNVFSRLSTPVSCMQFDSVFDALLSMGKRKPDLLILDLRLLAADWFTLIWTLWRNLELSGLTILVGTEMSENLIASRGKLPPDVQVFPKPIPSETLERICAVCSR